MNPIHDHDFHHRIDLFEPGDKTALVCLDVPETQRIVVDSLTEIGYKIHTGLFVEDILLKLQTHSYDIVVLSEQFNGNDLKSNPVHQAIIDIPPNQRRNQLMLLIGPTMHTDSEMESWSHSVDLVMNVADVANLKHVLRRAVQRTNSFYSPYRQALTEAGIL